MIDVLLRLLPWLFGSPQVTRSPDERAPRVAAYRLHVPRSLFHALRRITASDMRRGEPLAFLRVRFASEESRTVVVGIGVLPFPDQAYVEGHAGANFDTDFTVDVANQQITQNVGLLLVHSHGGKGIPTFSGIDDSTNCDVMGGLAMGIAVVPYGAVVLSETDARCVVAVDGKMVDAKVIAVPDRLGELSVPA
jgi:hypothetical protein